MVLSSSFTPCVEALLTQFGRWREGEDLDDAFGYSPARSLMEGRSYLQVLREHGYSVQTFRAESDARGVSAKWHYVSCLDHALSQAEEALELATGRRPGSHPRSSSQLREAEQHDSQGSAAVAASSAELAAVQP